MPKTTAKKPKTTVDALEIVHNMLFKGRSERLQMLEEARADDELARKIFGLRTEAGLSQVQLAKRIGTKASVIRLLEEADYDGHSFAMLWRIAAALDKRVEIVFV